VAAKVAVVGVVAGATVVIVVMGSVAVGLLAAVPPEEGLDDPHPTSIVSAATPTMRILIE
jgi:hypothetical protein